MELATNSETNVRNSTQYSLIDDINEEDVWQDLVGIAADPPDRREQCEHCL